MPRLMIARVSLAASIIVLTWCACWLSLYGRGVNSFSNCVIHSLSGIRHNRVASLALQDCRLRYPGKDTTIFSDIYLPVNPHNTSQCIIKYADKTDSPFARHMITESCRSIF